MYLSTNDFAGQFVDLVATQPRILVGYDLREAVVLADEQSMHGGESDLFVDSDIARQE